MVQPQWVEYIRANKDKYPVAALKKALIDAGAKPEEAEEAAVLAFAPPPPAAAPPPTPAAAWPSPTPASPAPTAEPAAESPSAASSAAAPPERAEGPVAVPAGSAQADSKAARGVVEIARAQALEVLRTPASFFRSMPKEGGFRDPLTFLVVVGVATGALEAAATLVFSLPNPFRGLLVAIGTLILVPIFVPIFSFVGAALAFVFWKVLGSKRGYETAFRCIAYASSATPIFSAFHPVPYLGRLVGLASLVYWVYLYVIVSVEVHEIARKRAQVACAALGGFCFLFMALGDFVLWQREKALEPAPPRPHIRVELPPAP